MVPQMQVKKGNLPRRTNIWQLMLLLINTVSLQQCSHSHIWLVLCCCLQIHLIAMMTAMMKVRASLWRSTRASSCTCSLKFVWAWISQRWGAHTTHSPVSVFVLSACLSSIMWLMQAVSFEQPDAATVFLLCYVSQVVLPTFILERRSLLEMYADFFAHPDLFVRYELHNNSSLSSSCLDEIFKYVEYLKMLPSDFQQYCWAARASGAHGSGGEVVPVSLPRREERLSGQETLQSNPGRSFLLPLGFAQWGRGAHPTHGETTRLCCQL